MTVSSETNLALYNAWRVWDLPVKPDQSELITENGEVLQELSFNFSEFLEMQGIGLNDLTPGDYLAAIDRHYLKKHGKTIQKRPRRLHSWSALLHIFMAQYVNARILKSRIDCRDRSSLINTQDDELYMLLVRELRVKTTLLPVLKGKDPEYLSPI